MARSGDRAWVASAVAAIEADFQRSADTHLLRLVLPGFPGIQVYLKDESTHPSGSLKHRLARSLFLYAICNGWIREGTTVIEASSGSTAVSEAYFAKLLGLPFVAVMPASTSPTKIAAIEHEGGTCRLVEDPARVGAVCRDLAASSGGHFMDQFTYAERATDWRGNNNIAESIFGQMAREPHPVPAWVVVGAGTGGTSATLGRYVRYRALPTRICVADPEGSAYFDGFAQGRRDPPPGRGSIIEGIGRPQVEPSFLPEVIDRVLQIPDVHSLAALQVLERLLGRRCGGSTGTNFVGVLEVAHEMKAKGEAGSIVTLLCDGGERYRHSYYDPAWLAASGFDLEATREALARSVAEGVAPPSVRQAP
ncbi:MAG: PLP-dependent cysteine synthase family protein [Geminicoccaceae bacterium]